MYREKGQFNVRVVQVEVGWVRGVGSVSLMCRACSPKTCFGRFMLEFHYLALSLVCSQNFQ